jgi:hypothetical protein
MPIVFIIAREWKLRAALRAELREMGIEAMSMDSPGDAGHALASGLLPAAIVLEVTAEITDHPALIKMLERIPAIAIASRTETVPLPPLAAVLYRPVRIADMVSLLRDLLSRAQPA